MSTPRGQPQFFAGAPAWQLRGGLDICGKDDKSIQLGYIQTVVQGVNAGVYRDGKTGAPGPADRRCVMGAHDCVGGASAPWYEAPGRELGTAGDAHRALLADTPFLSPLKSRRPKNPPDPRSPMDHLGMMYLTGTFNVWLVAQLKGRKIVFIHSWTLGLFARAMLSPDADPCNISQWVTAGGVNVAINAPGHGSGAPTLTGACANTLATPC